MTTREQVAAAETEMLAANAEWVEAKREAQEAMEVAKQARCKRDKANRLYLRHFRDVAMLLYGPDADPAIREERRVQRGRAMNNPESANL